MLAYVFWHWPNRDHLADEYERLQRAFHAALAQAVPAGFHGSYVFRLEGKAPWLLGEPAYADWYLVENSAALDPLNVAAISGVCEQPHADVARVMAAGAGSLFALHGDQVPANLGAARQITWLTKPRSMAYDTFYATVASLPNAAQTSLWRRQMVLGPTTEFALLSPTRLTVPDSLAPLFLSASPIWPDR